MTLQLSGSAYPGAKWGTLHMVLYRQQPAPSALSGGQPPGLWSLLWSSTALPLGLSSEGSRGPDHLLLHPPWGMGSALSLQEQWSGFWDWIDDDDHHHRHLALNISSVLDTVINTQHACSHFTLKTGLRGRYYSPCFKWGNSGTEWLIHFHRVTQQVGGGVRAQTQTALP